MKLARLDSDIGRAQNAYDVFVALDDAGRRVGKCSIVPYKADDLLPDCPFNIFIDLDGELRSMDMLLGAALASAEVVHRTYPKLEARVYAGCAPDDSGLIDVLNLPEYTYPVLGLAIGKPDQNPTVKPRMPRTMQFFENTYPADADGVLDQLPAFDEEVHRYYDLRQADRPVDAFSDQVATISRQDVSHQTLLDKAAAQGFRLDQ